MRLANIMVVPPDLPVKTVADFIAYTKANPGKLTLASSGNGTSVHMSGELFKMMASLDMVHVPYRGSAGIYPDLMTGKVHVLFDNLPGSIEFVRTGKLKALGVTTAKRNDALPDVPTVGETVQGYEASVFYGVAGPKGMPAEVGGGAEQGVQRSARRPEDPAAHQGARRRADADDARGSSASLWPTRPRSGPRWCGPRTCRWSDRDVRAKSNRPRGLLPRGRSVCGKRASTSSCAWRRSRLCASTPRRGSPCGSCRARRNGSRGRLPCRRRSRSRRRASA